MAKRRLIEFEMEGGQTVCMEVDESCLLSDDGTIDERASSEDDLLVKTGVKFEKAMDNLRNISNLLISKLKNVSSMPDQVSVTLHFKLGLTGNVIIASGNGEAGISTTLTWKKDSLTTTK